MPKLTKPARQSSLLAKDLVPKRCASAPVKFVSFECDYRHNVTGAGGVSDTSHDELNGCHGDTKIAPDTVFTEQIKHEQNFVEQSQNVQDNQVKSSSELGLTNGISEGVQSDFLDGSVEVSGDLAFTGVRKLRSRSLLEERGDKQGNTVVDSDPSQGASDTRAFQPVTASLGVPPFNTQTGKGFIPCNFPFL